VVAIPAVIAFNALRSIVDGRVQDTELLARTLLAFLKGAELEPVRSE
jgi:biopolymer transport protein ExbB/TolQ